MIKRQYFVSCEGFNEHGDVVLCYRRFFYIRSWFPKDNGIIAKEIIEGVSKNSQVEPSSIHIVAFNRA
jgi:hypothetical protein